MKVCQTFYSMYNFFRERVMKALSVSQKTVTKYVKVGNSGATYSTPGKSRPRKAPIRDVSEDVKEEIRTIVYEFSRSRKFNIYQSYYLFKKTKSVRNLLYGTYNTLN